MKFYTLSNEIEAALEDRKARPFVRISLEIGGKDTFISDSDIIECEMTSFREEKGGIVNKGTLVLSNKNGTYTPELHDNLESGIPVHVWYSFDGTAESFYRFSMYADKNGFQAEATGSEQKICTVGLIDMSESLKKLGTEADWVTMEPAVHCEMCNKDNPDYSIVHIIAYYGGFAQDEIDCSRLPYAIPYHEITESIWDELSEAARAYGAILECGRDAPLTFADSPYDTVNTYDDSSSYTLEADDITHYRRFDSYEKYANCVRLRFTKYSETEKTLLWTYADSPVMHDETMNALYLFNGDREIEKNDKYKASYTARNAEGKICSVVYAEDVDDKKTFVKNIETKDGKKLDVVLYDTESSRSSASLNVKAPEGGVLVKSMNIHGRAVIAEQNCSVYIHDDDAIQEYGLAVLNCTNRFLSTTAVEGKEQFRVFADRLLAERKKFRHSYFVKTNKALIHARAGASMCIDLGTAGTGIMETHIEEVTLRYKKDAAFETALWLETK